MTMADDFAWLDELLYGIDKNEGDDPRGWWETSTGDEFGARKLSELKAAIRTRDKATWISGWLAGARDGIPDPTPADAECAWDHREGMRSSRPKCPVMSVSLSGVPLLCDREPGHGGRHVQHMATDIGTITLEWYA